MASNARMREDAVARAELVASGVPMHTVASLYPVAERISSYLSEQCALEPWVDAAPTDDPEYWKMTQACDSTCHHPVHAFGHPERRAHLVEVPPFQ